MEGGLMTRNTKPEVFFPRPTLPPVEDDHSFGPWSYDDRRSAILEDCRKLAPAKLHSEIARYSTMLMEAESREHIARHKWESEIIPVEKLEAEHKLEETLAIKLDCAERLGLLKEAAASLSPQPENSRAKFKAEHKLEEATAFKLGTVEALKLLRGAALLSQEIGAENLPAKSAPDTTTLPSKPHESRAEISERRKKVVQPILDRKQWERDDWRKAAKVDWHTVDKYLDGTTRRLRKYNRTKLAESIGLSLELFPD